MVGVELPVSPKATAASLVVIVNFPLATTRHPGCAHPESWPTQVTVLLHGDNTTVIGYGTLDPLTEIVVVPELRAISTPTVPAGGGVGCGGPGGLVGQGLPLRPAWKLLTYA
ncbi:unannotated protein [freshwater metagenome]|uniref:Unannotated protein n=1 Tax=freshwater metagenome TaxID=449393 RepID=A0A6J7QX42_9ZZZZ